MSRSKKNIRTVDNYNNGSRIRLHNKRIAAFYNSEKERVNIGFQAILPEDQLSFEGNFIRGNYKNTVFGLSLPAAVSLYEALGKSLSCAFEKNIETHGENN